MRKFCIVAVLMAGPAVAFSDADEDWTVVEKSSQCHIDRYSGVAQLRLSAGRDGQINLRMLGKGWKGAVRPTATSLRSTQHSPGRGAFRP